MKFQLQSLRVIQCGPLDDVCIHFNTNGESPVTILAGANGSGKTTTLNCILGLVQMLDLGIYEPANAALMLSRPSRISVMHNMPDCTYAQLDCAVDDHQFCLVYGQSSGTTNRCTNTYGWSFADRRPPYPVSLGEIDGLINAEIHGQNRKSIAKILDRANEERSETNRIGIVPSFLYFPHERSIRPAKGNDQVRREEILYQWIYKFETVSKFSGSLDSYLIWLDYAEPELFAEVINFLNSLNFEGKKFGIRRKELRAIVTTKDGQTHGLSELSSGEQNILIMLLELQRRLLPYSIVLIDEIENSLHPAFQHKLAHGLKTLQNRIPFQLIFTTHSTELVDYFGSSSVRILTK